jgi:hypothetical protein
MLETLRPRVVRTEQGPIREWAGRGRDQSFCALQDVMPRISYPDLSKIDDPEILGYVEHARRHGTPRPESQAIRSHNPNVIRAFPQAWDLTFRNGVLDHQLKELCRVYVSKSIECSY